ncbi:MAG: D-alanine--D-alanine ligase, partial [Planctomycetota bacterium]
LAPLGRGGWMVKPDQGGSSVGAARVEPLGDLERALDGAFEHAVAVRIEAVVDGVELTCAVLGEGGAARALMPVEIVPDDGRFFDFEQKYASDGATERCPPRLVSADVIERIQADSLRVHRGFGCRGLTRSDFIVRPDQTPVFLELNTLPGMTPRSLAPQAAGFHGSSHRDLCLLLLDAALAPDGG